MASRKKTDPLADAEYLAQLEESLAAERKRRDAEWTRERIAAGHVVRLICDLRIGETEAGVIAARKAAHPNEDCLYILRKIFDPPPLLPAPVDGWRTDGPAPPAAWPDTEEESRVKKALDKPIRYRDLGLA